MRRLAALGALAALAAAGCGTPSPDLFAVERSGADPGANLRLIVSDGGTVRCNDAEHALDGDRLLTARQLQRDLAPQAELALELPSGPDPVLAYRAMLEQGTIAFTDTSANVPATFDRLAAFTTDVAERVCGIER